MAEHNSVLILPVEAARSLRIFGRRTESAIGASASQMPRKFLSERTARIKCRLLIPKNFAPCFGEQYVLRQDYVHRR